VIPGSVHVPLSVLYWRLNPTSGHDDPSISDPPRQVILVPHLLCFGSLQDRQGEEDAFDGSKTRRGPCKAIVSPIERTTLAAVEMDEAAVDGLHDGRGVLSAMEVDRHDR
jgi:hypothetical protein